MSRRPRAPALLLLAVIGLGRLSWSSNSPFCAPKASVDVTPRGVLTGLQVTKVQTSVPAIHHEHVQAPKTPVAQIILLDGVLLLTAFVVNLKCANRLRGVLSPEVFWGRLFVWI